MGKLVFSFLLAFFIWSDAYAHCRLQSPEVPDCQFYTQCLEETYKCGNEGYPLGYGGKYCSRFLSLGTDTPYANLSLSEKGLQWRNETLQCLQSEIVYQMDQIRTCNDISQIGFNSHANCYTQVPTSVCSLPLSDLITIPRVVDFTDYLSWSAKDQIVEVIIACGPELRSRLRSLLTTTPESTSFQLLPAKYSVRVSDEEVRELQLKLEYIEYLEMNHGY